MKKDDPDLFLNQYTSERIMDIDEAIDLAGDYISNIYVNSHVPLNTDRFEHWLRISTAYDILKMLLNADRDSAPLEMIYLYRTMLEHFSMRAVHPENSRRYSIMTDVVDDIYNYLSYFNYMSYF